MAAEPRAIRVKTPEGWLDLAYAGPQGPRGATGPQGTPGVTGPQGPPTMLATQRKAGTVAAYSALAATTGTFQDGAGGNMQIAFTPTADAWWHTIAQTYMDKVDAAYHYCLCAITLATADQDGRSAANNNLQQHGGVNKYSSRAIHRIWRLAGGIAYTATLTWMHNGGSWQHHTSPDNLWIEGMAWRQ